MIAATLQQNFVHPLPELEGWQFGLATESASAAALIGGDFHDVVAVEPHGLTVLLGDVEGKGIAAAGLTETVRAATRVLVLSATSPRYVLDRLNRLLQHDERQLVTALFAHINRVSGILTMGSAGHPAPLLLRRDGSIRPVALTPGPPLGAFTDGDYLVATSRISSDDALVFYTDGVTEARREGRFFAENGVIEALRPCAGSSAQDIADRLRDAVTAFADDLRDDVHILVVKRAPTN